MLQSDYEYAVEIGIFNVQTPKVCHPELWFLRSACRLMVLNICVKFHENILNCFEGTELTRECGKIAMFQCSTGNNSERVQSKVTIPVLCTLSYPS